MMNDDMRFYLKELRSTTCACEREKAPYRSFCARCFRALPGDLQRGLYRRMGDGYEEAYEAAFRWLQREGLIE